MSAWAQFLTDIQAEKEVTLVGPLYHQRHSPLMPTIYIDGGTRYRASGGWVAAAHDAAATTAAPAVTFPVISVGDGDSGGGALDELLPPDKDYSDLAFALRSLPTSVTEVTMLGFLGGRRDHEMANLGEVAEFLRRRNGLTRVDLAGAQGDRIVAFAKGALEIPITGTFSVFVFEPGRVEIGGMCRYPLSADQGLVPISSRGLSNEGMGKVHFSSDVPCLIFLNPVG